MLQDFSLEVILSTMPLAISSKKPYYPTGKNLA